MPKKRTLHAIPSSALLLDASGDPFIAKRAHCTIIMETQASIKLIIFRVERTGLCIFRVTIMPRIAMPIL